MENFTLTPQSGIALSEFTTSNRLMSDEKKILEELALVIKKAEQEQLNWFAQFGDGFYPICHNVREYRKGLEFGFTEIALNEHGWFRSPKFLEAEDITLEQSEVRIGRGPNHTWAYALRCNYGTAGNSGPLCVFCKKYSSRDAALTAALEEMKAKMSSYIGNSDTTNYKQDILHKTLKAISAVQVSMVQLTLF